MGKASNLIKKLLPIGLVIGGLLLLSQSKRVNIFKTTVPPEINIQPTQNIPMFFEKTRLVGFPVQETEKSLRERFGQLYTKERIQVNEPYQIQIGRYPQEKFRTVPNPVMKDVYTPLFEDDE